MPTNKITDNVTVGSADIYINNIDVGHMKETIEFQYTREKLPFKPANMLGDVVVFPIREEAMIRGRLAELKLANLKYALGVTTSISGSTTPSGIHTCSFDITAGTSWDTMTFGGSKAEATFCVRLEHTRPNGKKFIVIFYKAISMTELIVPFAEDEFTIHDLTLKALADATRSEGDQIGIILDQVQS